MYDIQVTVSNAIYSNAVYIYILDILSKGSTEQACSLDCTLQLTVILSSLLQLLFLLALKITIFSKLRQATCTSFSCFVAEVPWGGKDLISYHISVFLSWAGERRAASQISLQLSQKPSPESYKFLYKFIFQLLHVIHIAPVLGGACDFWHF